MIWFLALQNVYSDKTIYHNHWLGWSSAAGSSFLCVGWQLQYKFVSPYLFCDITFHSLRLKQLQFVVVVVVILMAFLANLYPLRQLLYGYPILLYGVMLSIACACLLKWEETGVPGGNPRKHGENMQTPHRKARAGPETITIYSDLLTYNGWVYIGQF